MINWLEPFYLFFQSWTAASWITGFFAFVGVYFCFHFFRRLCDV